MSHTSLVEDLTLRTLAQLDRLGIVDAMSDVLRVWPRPDRLVLIFNPARVRKPELLSSSRFCHRLSAALEGRRVVFTNTHGYFLQIAYEVPPTTSFETSSLQLRDQPSPLHVPVGQTPQGPLWLNLLEMDSVLVGGARRFGKTTLLHGWIQALLHGGQVEVLLWDGKGGLEFNRYVGQPNVTVAENLDEALSEVHAQMNERSHRMRREGATNLKDYNAQRGVVPFRPLVLVLDELAFLPGSASKTLTDLVARCGAFGVHPVVGLQRPDAESIRGLLRANLVTRLAFPCVSADDSRLILGRSGAEKLPKVKGRLAMVWEGKWVEAQAFAVETSIPLPAPNWPLRPQAEVIPGPPPLTERLRGLEEIEMQLVRIAVTELQGRFHIAELAARAGVSRHVVVKLAQRLEERGLLTPEESNPRGHKLGRLVVQDLLALAGLGR